ncbi:MAG: LPS export ABC transporter permease LptG [Pseudomonadota bacterium]
MKRLERYIAATVIGSSLTALAVLLALYIFITFVEEVGDEGALHALWYTLLTVPRWTGELFPVAALLGGLMGLGRLAGSSELTVMRAAGMSMVRITRAVFAGGLVLVVGVLVVAEGIAPHASAEAQRLESGGGGGALRLPAGAVWLRAGAWVVHADRVVNRSHLREVTAYRYAGEGELTAMARAESVRHSEAGWTFHDVALTRFGGERLTMEAPARLAWEGGPDPALMDLVATEPRLLAITDLWGYVDYLEANDLNSDAARLALWRKLISPLTTAGMLLLALPFVLGSLRTVSVGTRVFVGTLAGIVFFLFNNSFGNLAVVYGLSPLLGAGFPTLVVFAAAGAMAWRVRR